MNQQNLFSASSFNTPPKKELQTILKKLLTVFALILILISSLTCKKSPNEPDGQDFFSFTFEDVSCTEAWFNIKIFNLEKPVIASVYVNDALNSTFNIISSDDTTFYVENLLPKKNYEVYVELISANKKVYRSNRLSFTTMDTTSHNFTFQSWEFGDGSSSALYDVAIIDENNIWAVGEIYLKDSLGNYDPHAYNAVHWDGTKWELKRIPIYIQGIIFYPVITTIFAFNKNDIWFCGIHYNGQNFVLKNNGFPTLPNGDGWRENKMWGTSSNDLYTVGNNGMIAHWDGKRWTKIESGVNVIINDIYGDFNYRDKNYEIIFVGSSAMTMSNIVGKIKDLSVENIGKKNLPLFIRGIWFKSKRKYYVVGEGVFVTNNPDKGWDSIDITNYFSRDVTGTDLNDVYIVGDFEDFLHFNGYSWYRNVLPSKYGGGSFFRVEVKNKIVAFVGYDGPKARIVIAKRLG
jgi:hypothetical protein